MRAGFATRRCNGGRVHVTRSRSCAPGFEPMIITAQKPCKSAVWRIARQCNRSHRPRSSAFSCLSARESPLVRVTGRGSGRRPSEAGQGAGVGRPSGVVSPDRVRVAPSRNRDSLDRGRRDVWSAFAPRAVACGPVALAGARVGSLR
jgi:hypothetical protein